MIFVSVGSMMPFDRLVQAVDAWAAAHPGTPVLAQIGNGKFEPRHAKFVRLMPVADYRRAVAEASLFVAHAGMGSIITAIEAGKPLLMLPRLQALGEHNTDHQLATVRNVGNRAGLHHVLTDAELGPAIDALLGQPGEAPAPISAFASEELLGNVRDFVHGRRS
ncbi:glycosyltransferase [Glacieibacterium sp.]|uniref:glycosyltransferase n=1 Tax=Glacieibacterium sp. TaxID=2860237 RepID=UPI003AFFE092